MGNPTVQTLAFTAGDRDGIALSQSPAAAGALTLNGPLSSGGVGTLPEARRVGVYSSADDTARTFTITGTDRYSNPQSEILAGANAGVAVSVLDYLTVTSVVISGASAGSVEVGSTTTGIIGSGPWVVTSIYITQFQLDMFVTVASASPANWSIEVTPDDPNVMAPPGGVASNLAAATPGIPPRPGSGTNESASFSPPQAWAGPAALTNKSAAAHALLEGIPYAWRLTILSGTTAVTAQGIQAGVAN